MTPDQILEIANSPDTTHFVFGESLLAEWTRDHYDRDRGVCVKNSPFYVVVHSSPLPEVCRRFRVLSRWIEGLAVPLSFDVPEKKYKEHLQTIRTSL